MKNATRSTPTSIEKDKKVRVNFDVLPSVNQTLARLVDQLGMTKSELLRRAIDLMELAVEEKEKGNRLAIMDKDQKVITRIVGF